MLPTVALLLVMLGLVVGALIFRTGTRTEQIIGERQEKVIVNAASPAIDRAKSKLEQLFDDDIPPATHLKKSSKTFCSVGTHKAWHFHPLKIGIPLLTKRELTLTV